MPKASTKHPERMHVLDFSDFSGGEVYGVSAESLAMNELQVLTNWEYDTITGHPRVIYPFVEYCDVGSPIDEIFVNELDQYILASCRGSLYKIPFSTGAVVPVEGALSGANVPSFALWSQSPRKVLIASGGQLQSYDGTTLSTVEGSPDADIVFVRGPAGRVVVARTGYDKLIYSAVGDETGWTDDPANDSSSKEIEVGYKDSGDIIAVVPMPTDIIVFKSNGRVYRVIGEFPDWVIKENQNHMESSIISRHTAVRVANDVMYLGKEGFRALSVTEKYGDMLQHTVSEKVDRYLATMSTTAARVWYVPSKGQIFINPNGSSSVWILHIATQGAWSHMEFDSAVTQIFEYHSDLYIVSGQKIYKQVQPTQGTADISAAMKMKRIIFDRDVIVKQIIMNLQPVTNTYGSLQVSGVSLPFNTNISGDIAYEDDDIACFDTDPLYTLGEQMFMKRCNVRTNVIEPVLVIDSGCVSVRKIVIYYAEG